MLIKVQCPGCAKILSAQERHRNKTITCANCGRKFGLGLHAVMIGVRE